MPVKISTRNIYKNYGAVEALRGVSIDIHEGEVHAICGDNGAGKSTLIKVLAGVEMPDRGEVVIDGAPCRFTTPTESLKAGLATIHQDLAVAARMSIYENIFMGAELTKNVLGIRMLDKKKMRQDAAGYMSQLNKSITDMNIKVEELSGGQRQAVAICRALRWNANIVILDEPTAALGVRETEQVLEAERKDRHSHQPQHEGCGRGCRPGQYPAQRPKPDRPARRRPLRRPPVPLHPQRRGGEGSVCMTPHGPALAGGSDDGSVSSLIKSPMLDLCKCYQYGWISGARIRALQ